MVSKAGMILYERMVQNIVDKNRESDSHYQQTVASALYNIQRIMRAKIVMMIYC